MPGSKEIITVSQPEDRIDSADHKGMSAEDPRILWRAGREKFQSGLIDLALQAEGRDTEHPAHGRGTTWKLATGWALPAELTIFPRSRLAKLRFHDALTELQVREYVIDRASTSASGTATLRAFDSCSSSL